jgi:ribosomal protein S6--L-glutamate ligase
MKILILATGNPSKNLTDAITQAGHRYIHYRPKDLYLLVSESTNGYDRVYAGRPEDENPLRLLLKDYDAIITRLGSDLAYSTSVLLHLTENLGIYCPQSEEGLMTASNKMKTTQKLSANGLRVPKTIFAKKPTHVKFLVDKVGGLPCVAKTLTGSQGKGVFILRDEEQTNTSLEAIYNLDVDLLLQGFVESGAKDIRAIVVGGEVVAAMERTGKKDFRANLSQGGSGRAVQLSAEDKEICVKASEAVGLQFSGVDILKDVNGKTYVIEVNGNPGELSIKVTGVNWFKNLVKYIEGNYKNVVADRVTASYCEYLKMAIQGKQSAIARFEHDTITQQEGKPVSNNTNNVAVNSNDDDWMVGLTHYTGETY